MIAISVKRLKEIEDLFYQSLIALSKDPLMRDFFFEDPELKIPRKQFETPENLQLIARKMDIPLDEMETYIYFHNHAQRFSEQYVLKNLHQDFKILKEFAKKHHLNAKEFVAWVDSRYVTTMQLLKAIKGW